MHCCDHRLDSWGRQLQLTSSFDWKNMFIDCMHCASERCWDSFFLLYLWVWGLIHNWKAITQQYHPKTRQILFSCAVKVTFQCFLSSFLILLFQFHYVQVSGTNLLFSVYIPVQAVFSQSDVDAKAKIQRYTPLKHLQKSSFDVGISLFKNLATSPSSDYISWRLAHKKSQCFYPPIFQRTQWSELHILLTRVSRGSKCNIKPVLPAHVAMAIMAESTASPLPCR